MTLRQGHTIHLPKCNIPNGRDLAHPKKHDSREWKEGGRDAEKEEGKRGTEATLTLTDGWRWCLSFQNVRTRVSTI